jgi:NAD(P)-dependent dehydrogenase (short-subunit alcohol dehydrogenase family)
MATTTAKTFLVTGSSSGIGETTTRVLVGRGHRVFAGVRRSEDAERLTRELGERCLPVILDATDATQIAAAAATIEAAGALDGLVNNAGIAISGPLEFLPLDDLRKQFEVNVIGVVAVTQAMLPLLRRTHGRIVVVSSVGGRTTLPFVAPYNASKHAINAIAEGLRMELVPAGVDVILIEPGAVRTPIWERSDRTAEALVERLPPLAIERYGDVLTFMRDTARKTGERGIAPEFVANAIVHALEDPHPKTRYTVGTDARIGLLLRALPDRMRERLIRKIFTGSTS